MRKIFLLMIACSMIFLLIGCSDTKNKVSSEINNAESKFDEFVSDIPHLESDVPSATEDSSQTEPIITEHVSSVIEAAAEPDNILQGLNSLSGEKKGHGLGSATDELGRPVDAVQLQEKYGSLGGLFIGEPEKNIYLTFDEGYENGFTTTILNTLKAKNCTAVFFVTMDYVKSNPDLIKRMIDEGHVVGNHTVNHPSMPELTLEKAKEEIEVLHNYMIENFNYTMTLFRPPMGEYSEKTLVIAQRLGYKTMLWSFAYKDWLTDSQPDAASSLEKIVNSAHDGAIYLLHAVSSTNDKILGDAIDSLRAKGYTVGAYN